MPPEELRRFTDGSDEIIGACIEVHRHLGPGLLESVYERCLCHELQQRGIAFVRQLPIPLNYKGLALDCGLRLDLVVEGRIIVEVKAIERFLPIHEAQVLTYLKLTNLEVGLLVNFDVPVVRAGLRRLTLRGRTDPDEQEVGKAGREGGRNRGGRSSWQESPDRRRLGPR